MRVAMVVPWLRLKSVRAVCRDRSAGPQDARVVPARILSGAAERQDVRAASHHGVCIDREASRVQRTEPQDSVSARIFVGLLSPLGLGPTRSCAEAPSGVARSSGAEPDTQARRLQACEIGVDRCVDEVRSLQATTEAVLETANTEVLRRPSHCGCSGPIVVHHKLLPSTLDGGRTPFIGPPAMRVGGWLGLHRR